jgi:hypothetical protein
MVRRLPKATSSTSSVTVTDKSHPKQSATVTYTLTINPLLGSATCTNKTVLIHFSPPLRVGVTVKSHSKQTATATLTGCSSTASTSLSSVKVSNVRIDAGGGASCADPLPTGTTVVFGDLAWNGGVPPSEVSLKGVPIQGGSGAVGMTGVVDGSSPRPLRRRCGHQLRHRRPRSQTA